MLVAYAKVQFGIEGLPGEHGMDRFIPFKGQKLVRSSARRKRRGTGRRETENQKTFEEREIFQIGDRYRAARFVPRFVKKIDKIDYWLTEIVKNGNANLL